MLKWNLCRNDNSKTVYGGTKSPVSVSDEKVQANRDRVYFYISICIYDLPQKNRLLTSDIHYLWNGNNFKGVISFKFKHFHKKFVA